MRTQRFGMIVALTLLAAACGGDEGAPTDFEDRLGNMVLPADSKADQSWRAVKAGYLRCAYDDAARLSTCPTTGPQQLFRSTDTIQSLGEAALEQYAVRRHDCTLVESFVNPHYSPDRPVSLCWVVLLPHTTGTRVLSVKADDMVPHDPYYVLGETRRIQRNSYGEALEHPFVTMTPDASLFTTSADLKVLVGHPAYGRYAPRVYIPANTTLTLRADESVRDLTVADNDDLIEVSYFRVD